VPIRSATGYSSWRFLQPAAPNGPHGVPPSSPPPFAAGDAVLVSFAPLVTGRKPPRYVEAAAVVLSCQPGLVPIIRVRFTAGGLAGSTAGIPAHRVRKAP
jgi:hypothetical protein